MNLYNIKVIVSWMGVKRKEKKVWLVNGLIGLVELKCRFWEKKVVNRGYNCKQIHSIGYR